MKNNNELIIYDKGNKMKKTTILLISIIIVSNTFAQSRAQCSPRTMHRPNKIGMIERERRGENREQMMAWKITKHLELTTEQADKFFPRMREHREIMKKINNEIVEVKIVLQNKIYDNKEVSDADLKNILTKVNDLQDTKANSRDQFIRSLDDVLDNTQIAKLAMVPKHFRHESKNQKRNRPKNR